MILLTECLSVHNIQLLKSRDRLSAIKTLVDLVSDQVSWEDRLSLLEALIFREESQSTAILPDLAIPHARTAAIEDIRCALGIAPQGVDFKAANGHDSHLILLIILAPHKESQYLALVSHLLELFADQKLLTDLSRAVSPSEIWKLLAIAEKRYPLLPCYAGRRAQVCDDSISW